MVGVPIAAPETCQQLGELVDEMVCAVTPEPFHSVGDWYVDFTQTTDAEVRELLEASREWAEAPSNAPLRAQHDLGRR